MTRGKFLVAAAFLAALLVVAVAATSVSAKAAAKPQVCTSTSKLAQEVCADYLKAESALAYYFQFDLTKKSSSAMRQMGQHFYGPAGFQATAWVSGWAPGVHTVSMEVHNVTLRVNNAANRAVLDTIESWTVEGTDINDDHAQYAATMCRVPALGQTSRWVVVDFKKNPQFNCGQYYPS